MSEFFDVTDPMDTLDIAQEDLIFGEEAYPNTPREDIEFSLGALSLGKASEVMVDIPEDYSLRISMN